MNLNTFLKQVNDTIEDWTRDQLVSFIQQQAVSTPEENRTAFLSALRASGVSRSAKEKTFDREQKTLKEQAQEMMEELDSIPESGEYLDSSLEYEDYDRWNSWADDEGETFEFSDSFGILDTVKEACALVHSLADAELYQEAYDLCEKLREMEINVGGDYVDYNDPVIDLEDLSTYVDGIPYRQVLLDGAFSAYYAYDNAEDRITPVFSCLDADSLSLKDLEERAGNMLPDYDSFLRTLCRYQVNIRSTRAEQMLDDALSRLEDPSFTLEIAKQGADLHPEVYRKYIESLTSPDEIIKAARDALPRMNNKDVKAVVASYGVKAAEETGTVEDRKYFRLEEFRADPEMDTYLHLTQEFQGEMKEEISAAAASIKGESRYAIAFLQKNFDLVLDEGMKESSYLGWSSTFMKEGISLFLIYFYKDETLPRDVSALFRNHLEDVKSDRSNDLQEIVLRWKAANEPDPELIKRVIPKLENWIRKRTDAIMKENRRNYYWECAEFTAALGEVEQSLGIRSKQEVLTEAAGWYPARRNYIADLKNHGYVKRR